MGGGGGLRCGTADSLWVPEQQPHLVNASPRLITDAMPATILASFRCEACVVWLPIQGAAFFVEADKPRQSACSNGSKQPPSGSGPDLDETPGGPLWSILGQQYKSRLCCLGQPTALCNEATTDGTYRECATKAKNHCAEAKKKAKLGREVERQTVHRPAWPTCNLIMFDAQSNTTCRRPGRSV